MSLGAPKGGPKPRKNLARKGGAPKGGVPKGGRPKISLFFSLSLHIFLSFSLGGPFVDFLWCLKRRDPEMCTFGVFGLSCEAPSAPNHTAFFSNEKENEENQKVTV